MENSNKIHIDWSLTRKELAAAIVCILLIGFLCVFAIIAFTGIRNLIPGYPTATVRRQQVQNELRMDSLQRSIFRWELYSENLRRVLEGNPAIKIDSLIKQAQQTYVGNDNSHSAAADSTIRSIVANDDKFSLYQNSDEPEMIEGLHFFKPLNGTVTKHYDVAQHPYIDVTAPGGSAVKSVLDGSVIYTEWTEAYDWCIIVQHEKGIISIYKHNEKLLKKVTDKVSAGTSIAILGNNMADQTYGPHLHFELWQNGIPLDPSLYIRF